APHGRRRSRIQAARRGGQSGYPTSRTGRDGLSRPGRAGLSSNFFALTAFLARYNSLVRITLVRMGEEQTPPSPRKRASAAASPEPAKAPARKKTAPEPAKATGSTNASTPPAKRSTWATPPATSKAASKANSKPASKAASGSASK